MNFFIESEFKQKMRRDDENILALYPEIDPAVLQFITDFVCRSAWNEDQYEIIRSTFRAGYCWYFAHMLKLAFQRGEVCWAAPFGHFVWVDDNGVPYDIEGANFGEQEYHIPERYLGDYLRDFMHVPGDKTPAATQSDINTIIKKYESDRKNMERAEMP